jgi:asparagine synthase (glutamine-hydrolysing)
VKEGKIDLSQRGMAKIHSFCIGLQGSPDLSAAEKVASFLGTEHHSFEYTVDEGIDAIPEVIYHIESYNNTTVRASTPMYLLARKIKSLGIKYCLTGEGADEIFGGYLYFHKAPNPEELHKETVRKVKDLYKFDLLRANKSCLAWGLEVRPPFLQKKFIEYAMSLDPKYKYPKNNPYRIEKYILRKAFDCEQNPYLPSEILWRQKEQFSDGVGYKWRDGISVTMI